jgi:hypothetical protein
MKILLNIYMLILITLTISIVNKNLYRND